MSLAATRLAIAVVLIGVADRTEPRKITKRTRTDVEIAASDAGGMMDGPSISKLQRNRLALKCAPGLGPSHEVGRPGGTIEATDSDDLIGELAAMRQFVSRHRLRHFGVVARCGRSPMNQHRS